MAGSKPREGWVHSGHFILRIQRPASGKAALLYLVEDVRTGEVERCNRLEDALAFIQAHLAPEDEQA